LKELLKVIRCYAAYLFDTWLTQGGKPSIYLP